MNLLIILHNISNQLSGVDFTNRKEKGSLDLLHVIIAVIYCRCYHHGSDGTKLNYRNTAIQKLSYLSQFSPLYCQTNVSFAQFYCNSVFSNMTFCQLPPYFHIYQPEHYYFYPLRPQIKFTL